MLLNFNSEDRSFGSNETPTFTVLSLGMRHTTGGGKIGVKSIELPYTFFTCRNGINNAFRYTQSNGTTSKIIYLSGSVIEGSPNINVIVANLKAQLDVNTEGAVWTITVNASTGKLTFLSTFAATFTQIDPEVFAMIGLNAGNPPTFFSNLAYTTPHVINVNPVKYVFVHSDLPTSVNDYDSFTKNHSQVITKIPINVNAFSNVFVENSEIEYRPCGQISSVLSFRLTDTKNREINLNGVPWSITLDFDKY
jgi:hypothetical protein